MKARRLLAVAAVVAILAASYAVARLTMGPVRRYQIRSYSPAAQP